MSKTPRDHSSPNKFFHNNNSNIASIMSPYGNFAGDESKAKITPLFPNSLRKNNTYKISLVNQR